MNSRAEANKRSFSDPITVRARMRTRSVFGKFCNVGSKILVIGAYDGEYSGLGARERTYKPIETLLPREPAQEQNKRLLV
jgi:hypothetical protein